MAITNGYATLQNLKDFLSARGETQSYDSTDDSTMELLIEGASRYIDAQTGRTFYGRTETHYLDLPDDGDRTIYLDDDLISVTTLTNGDGTVLTTASYYLLPRNRSPKYAVVMKESSLYAWAVDSSGNTEGVITLVGSWGWSATASTDIKEACLGIAQRAYSNRSGQATGGSMTVTASGTVIRPDDVPPRAQQIIERYRKIT